jgi:DNA-binding NarL/FixJ family response regulator
MISVTGELPRAAKQMVQRLLVVSPDGDLLQEIREILRLDAAFCVGTACDDAGVLASFAAFAPAVVLIDGVASAAGAGLDICARLRALSADVGLIMITEGKDVEERLRAFEHGSDDCLARPLDARELLARTRVLAGRSAQPRASSPPAHLRAGGRPPRGIWDREQLEPRATALAHAYRLSPREREILLLIAQGVHLKEVGARLGCGYSSVRTHVRRMAKKLACSGSKELIVKFLLDAGAIASGKTSPGART